MSTSTEVERWLDKNKPVSSVVQFARVMDLESTIDSGVLDPAILEIMSGILNADSEDAIFAAANAGTTSGKDFIDNPFMLKSEAIQWKKSAAAFQEQGGFPFYALMRVMDMMTGELRVLNCGGLSFLTTLWKLAQLGVIAQYDDNGGMPLVLTEKAASSGYTVLLLKKYQMPKVSPTDGTKSD